MQTAKLTSNVYAGAL